MGTRLCVEIPGEDAADGEAAGEAVVDEVERVGGLLSTWDPSSALSRLDAAPVGRAVRPDPGLRSLLAEVWRWIQATRNAFDPRVGALVDAWDLRGAGRRPDARALKAAREASGPGAVTLDPTCDVWVRHDPAAWVDAGAFGKGAALRSAEQLLRDRGVSRAFVDLGGQVVALSGPGDEPWSVEVAHPRHRRQPVARLRLAGVSAATSGTSERFIEVDGERYGHILDPRTGQPAPAWGSVTVVSADPLIADILSTAFYVMGPRAGMAWLGDRTDVGVLFLEERDGMLLPSWNPAMERWLDTSSILVKPSGK